jgi:hypothetical protein
MESAIHGEGFAPADRSGQAGFLSRDKGLNLQPALPPHDQKPFVLVNYSPTICLNPPLLMA